MRLRAPPTWIIVRLCDDSCRAIAEARIVVCAAALRL